MDVGRGAGKEVDEEGRAGVTCGFEDGIGGVGDDCVRFLEWSIRWRRR